jgi:proteic killer suppression protein
VIKTFADKVTAALYEGILPLRVDTSIALAARRKLRQIDTAEALQALRVPPGNRLEKLTGDRAGQHSIRVNRQWRICFTFRDGDAYNVEFCDYH